MSKASGITSIADFISTRYGRSARLAGLLTLVMLASSVPYIALQLQAVAESLTLLLPLAPGLGTGEVRLATAVLLAVFAILFGARHTDLSAHRPGLVAAIAFEFGRQAHMPHRGRAVRRAGAVRRLRRPVRPGQGAGRSRRSVRLEAPPADSDGAAAFVDGGGLLPAAPVPHDRGREPPGGRPRAVRSGASRSTCC